MKRLNSNDRIAWIRLCQKREKKPEKKRLKLKKNKQWVIRKKLKEAKASKAYITLHAPVWFELIRSKNHKKLLEFLGALRNRVLIQKKSVKIDFSSTKRMVVCGTLLFFF